MAGNKRDLEDEMSRFEMEIAGQLPPPPKLPNLNSQLPSVQPVGGMPLAIPLTNAQQQPSAPTPIRAPGNQTLLSQAPSFPGISPPNVIRPSIPSSVPLNQIPPQGTPSAMPVRNMPVMPPVSMPMPFQRPPQTAPMRMPTGLPPGMARVPLLQRPPSMPVGQMQLPSGPPPSMTGQSAMPPMPPMQVQPPTMPPGMPMMSMPFGMPFTIQPPTVPLDEYRPSASSSTAVVQQMPPAMENKPETSNDKKKDEKKKKVVRVGGGQVWEDDSLKDWDTNDFRIFCGDLGNEVTDDQLYRAFSKYPSLLKAKVIRDKRSKKTKGYGFVSFKNPQEYLRAMREMNGKYLGNRPIKLRKSTWKDRNIEIVKKKDREKKKLGLR